MLTSSHLVGCSNPPHLITVMGRLCENGTFTTLHHGVVGPKGIEPLTSRL
jgi:hypothetical protein